MTLSWLSTTQILITLILLNSDPVPILHDPLASPDLNNTRKPPIKIWEHLFNKLIKTSVSSDELQWHFDTCPHSDIHVISTVN